MTISILDLWWLAFIIFAMGVAVGSFVAHRSVDKMLDKLEKQDEDDRSE